MLIIFYYFISSLLSSTLGTLIGAGGSAILGPLLLLTESSLGTSIGAKNIIGTSLACVVANSVSGSYRYLKIGTVDIRSGIIFSIIGIPFSIFAAFTLIEINTSNFKIMFGITLILITIFMIYQSMKNETGGQSKKNKLSSIEKLNGKFFHEKRKILTKNGEEYEYNFSLGLASFYNIFLGFIATFFGIGGGIIRTPLLIYISKFPVKIATATSVFSLLCTSLAGTLVYWMQGFYDLNLFFPAALGALIGAQIGAQVSKFLSGKWIIRILAIVLLIMGLLLIIQNL